ncbi:GNAT family N-acetyltransferase [Limosilactobacillus fermentum]|uniref:GNAT family N-acetyltransferase n=1 Tax=Limosilactobacillus fermentum TaxID=1613 RepID=UPI00234AAC15|nr:GNAT family N-acetyltransferase [Limosilactobacillus fermentum]MDC6078952.1 GNAT family N-acetyltransferase [Limosilactobacillus fermentum]
MVVTMKQTAKATEATYMRKATLEDLDRIWEIVEDARALLKADGSEQWQNGYPTRLTFQQDIEFGNCYLMIAGDRIAGTVTLMPQGDTHYNYIVDGEWAMPGHPFATIHRIATHDKNDRVHNLVQNFGFVKRGKVYTGPTPDDLRNVYELNLK